MEIINNNPYRVVGVLSNASVRELQRQQGKITAYAQIGREIDSEFDFNILKPIIRSTDVVNKAFANIQQNQDKVNHALFWFINTSPFDNTAIEYLKNDDLDKAIEIWDRVTNNKEVNSRNFSAFNNLGTCKLLSANTTDIQEGIEAKIELIESDYFKDFAHAVADQTFTIDNDKQIKHFINELLSQFKGHYTASEILDLFSGCNGVAKTYLIQKLTGEPLHKIERQIENTKDKRKEDPEEGYKVGMRLYVDCKDDLAFLESILGVNDLKYRMLVDNVAKEMLQCGIDYFEEKKTVMNSIKKSLRLLRLARKMIVSSQTLDRINDNIDGIEEWARIAPVKDDLDFVINELDAFKLKISSIANAKSLVNSCKPKLQNIKNILGSNNELYLNISTAVANNATGMLVNVVNAEQNSQDVQFGIFERFRKVLRGALSVSSQIDAMDMHSEQRNHFNRNFNTLRSIANQAGVSSRPKPRPRPRTELSPEPISEPISEPIVPVWLQWVGGIILFIIMVNACS